MAKRFIKIPDKTFFTVGEVCKLAGVQAHVLRYWESEFPELAPKKLRKGQRSYHKRDVEIALRIKELLYEEQYTIAGAKRKLISELDTRVAISKQGEIPIIVMGDADPNISDAVSEYMSRAGYKVFIAENGPEVLETTRGINPDIIILETLLPVVDGLEVCRLLKADPRTQHIPVLFLSSRDDVVDKVLGLEVGASDFITKPFSLRELEARVKVVLRREKQPPRKTDASGTKALKKKGDPYRLVGSVFSRRYELNEYSGGGGMGAVYRSRDLLLNETVAVKILKPDVAAKNPEYMKLFQIEVQNAQRLSHSHIVKVLDTGADDDIVFMVMEWINGRSLEDIVSEEKLPSPRIVNIFEQVCSAVAFAHGEKIIHLDIKPANILLIDESRPRDNVKIIDFGLSRIISKESGTTVTRFRGTHQFCAPEQFGGKVSHRSDVYSLGATLYYLITGVIPFSTSYINAKMHANLELPDIPTIANQSGLPERIDQVLGKALNKNPDLRHQSVMELFKEFSDIVLASNQQ